jgi:hypothetical protein
MCARSTPKLAPGDPLSDWPTPFRDFAVLTPPHDAPIDGAVPREPDSIDADADGFVQAVWSTTRGVAAVSCTKRKDLGPPLQRSSSLY